MSGSRRKIVIWLRYPKYWRYILAGAAMALLIAVIVNEMPSNRTWSQWATPLSGRIIVVDAGHGGPDGGAVSRSGIIEKDISLAVSLYLRDLMQQAGAIVYMTRETDKDLADEDNHSNRKHQDLVRRAEFVTDKSADMLLTIHLNSIPSPRWRGAQTFYYPNHDDNKVLATLIQEELIRNLGNTDRLAKQTPNEVYLLKSAKIPAALVEVGFLSNPEEANLLANDKYQRQIAAAIYEGVLRYVSGETLVPEA